MSGGTPFSAGKCLQLHSWGEVVSAFPGLKYLSDMEKGKDLEFRTYQCAAVLAWHSYGGRGVIRAATGSGKTLIAAGLAASVIPLRTLVLVHGAQLFQQTLAYFQDIFNKRKKIVGSIAGKEYDPGAITVASIDTLSYYLRAKCAAGEDPKEHDRKRKLFQSFLSNDVDFLIWDECHHGSADSWKQVGSLCPAYYRAGLSGTPLKHDLLSDLHLMSLVGPVIFEVDSNWLQKNNYLAQARLIIKTQDFSEKGSRGWDYQEARKKLIVENKTRSLSIAEDIAQLLQDKNNRVMVLTGNSVDLAMAIAEALRGLESRFKGVAGAWDVATGKMSSRAVKTSLDGLRTGKIRCIIVTKLADEGIDVPDVNTLLIVGGGKAFVPTIQRIGRGLRKKAGDQELVVYEYFVTGNKYVEKHDKLRLKIYEQENCFSEIRGGA